MVQRHEQDEEPQALPRRRVRRRTFIKVFGGGGLVVAAKPDGVVGAIERATQAVGDGPDVIDVVEVDPPQFASPLSFRKTLRRRADMVHLTIEAYNLRVDRRRAGRPRLRLVDPARDGGLVVIFPPQSVLEETVPFPAVNPTPGALGARLSGSSRLSFVLPRAAMADGIPFTTQGLLDWGDWFLNTAPVARRAVTDFAGGLALPLRPAEPTSKQTSIEAPWWLQISPNRRGGFVGATRPVVGADSSKAELWHARFATRTGIGPELGALTEAPSPNRAIRAIWSPDPELATWLPAPASADAGTEPFDSTLTQSDRVSLIRLTADEVLTGSATGRVAVPVDTLTLSALGATLELQQSFANASASAISLTSWSHRATLGRDHYVRVVNRGYLMPFGHAASLVRISERKFIGNGAERTAVLEQRKFLQITQPTIDHDSAATIPNAGRGLPFRTVRIRNTTSPEISRSALPGSGVQTARCFFPRIAGTSTDLVFEVTAVDRDGNVIDVLMPMAFVDGAFGDDPAAMATIRSAWNSYTHPTRRWARLNSQRVSYAPSLAQRPGATGVQTERIRFDVSGLLDDAAPAEPAQRRFWGSMAIAEIRLDEVEALSSNAIGSTTLQYDSVYRTDGFDSPTNAGGVWASVGTAAGIGVRFSRPPASADQPGPGTDRAGGVISPDLQIRGLSRSIGVVAGDPQALRSGTFDPVSFFAGPNAPKLLGGISIIDVIEPAQIPIGQPAPSTALAITTRRTADAVESSMVWSPSLRSDPDGVFSPGTFRLDALTRTPLDGSGESPSTRIDGELSNFAINVPNGSNTLIEVQFDRLRFTQRDGRTPDVDVDVGDVLFRGELEYIETLSKYLDFGNGGVDISVLPDRVSAGVAIELPNLVFGVFTLRNIRFAAGLDIPLSGEPVRLRFQFSTRDDPFRLTVLGLGGGGHVMIAFGTDGLEALELGFEGGAEVAIDVGIATWSVSAMFGVVLVVDNTDTVDTASFVAYFRMVGEVSVGPVSAGVCLTMQLGYENRTKNGKTVQTLFGRASLEIEVSVPLLPSPTITVTLERSFKNDAADPTFGDQFNAVDYDALCDAYGA